MKWVLFISLTIAIQLKGQTSADNNSPVAKSLCGKASTFILRFDPVKKTYDIRFVKSFEENYCHRSMAPSNSNVEINFFDNKDQVITSKRLFFNHTHYYDNKDPKSGKQTGGAVENTRDLEVIFKMPISLNLKYARYEILQINNRSAVGGGKL